MLTIRSAQMAVLHADLLQRWIAAHLRARFHGRCEPYDEPGLMDFVREQMRRARAHGFSDPAHLCRYVQVALHVGAGFDADPRLPWAAALLADRRSRNDATRIELLQAAASDQLLIDARGPQAEDEPDDEAESDLPAWDEPADEAELDAAEQPVDEDDDEEEEEEDEEEEMADEGEEVEAAEHDGTKAAAITIIETQPDDPAGAAPQPPR